MKHFHNYLITAALTVASVSAAVAGGFGSHSYTGAIPGLPGSSLNIVIDGGVATVYGQADSPLEARLARYFTYEIAGVRGVIDRTTVKQPILAASPSGSDPS